MLKKISSCTEEKIRLMVKAVVTSHDPIHLNATKRTNTHDLDLRQIYITLLLYISLYESLSTL